MKQYKDTPYYITQDGKIYRNGREIFGWILKKKGYRGITIYFNGEKRKEYVHRLVGELYLDNPDNKPQINHKNGNKLDNRSENLEWVTNQENRTHAIKNGLMKFGEDYSHTKLTKEQVIWIRKNYIPKHPEFSGAALSRKFGVGNAQISRIVNNKRWKHI